MTGHIYTQKYVHNYIHTHAHTYVARYEDLTIGDIKGLQAAKMLLIVGVMTLHSFAVSHTLSKACKLQKCFCWFQRVFPLFCCESHTIKGLQATKMLLIVKSTLLLWVTLLLRSVHVYIHAWIHMSLTLRSYTGGPWYRCVLLRSQRLAARRLHIRESCGAQCAWRARRSTRAYSSRGIQVSNRECTPLVRDGALQWVHASCARWCFTVSARLLCAMVLYSRILFHWSLCFGLVYKYWGCAFGMW